MASSHVRAHAWLLAEASNLIRKRGSLTWLCLPLINHCPYFSKGKVGNAYLINLIGLIDVQSHDDGVVQCFSLSGTSAISDT